MSLRPLRAASRVGRVAPRRGRVGALGTPRLGTPRLGTPRAARCCVTHAKGLQGATGGRREEEAAMKRSVEAVARCRVLRELDRRLAEQNAARAATSDADPHTK
ncbi:hypothetical protein M446_1286 [Methylobacterium sp. 4-46]|nr:hypothetical protein M446_1286 [Methylobacterium sp. 4-46]